MSVLFTDKDSTLENQLNEEIAAYRKQIEIVPNHELAWNNLGNALSELEQLDEAIAAYRKQIEIVPNHESAWHNLAITYWEQGELEQAQQTFAHALAINPQDLYTLSNDVELALVQQDKARCLQRIQSALALVTHKNQEYVILPFLAWLAEPENTLDAVYTAIQQLDHNVKIGWNFTDTSAIVHLLSPEQQCLARQFITYFQGKGELPMKPN